MEELAVAWELGKEAVREVKSDARALNRRILRGVRQIAGSNARRAVHRGEKGFNRGLDKALRSTSMATPGGASWRLNNRFSSSSSSSVMPFKRPRFGGSGSGSSSSSFVPRRRRKMFNQMSKFHLTKCVEKKVHDKVLSSVQLNGGTVDGTRPALGNLTSLVQGIAQGDTHISRAGRKIYMWALDVKGELYIDQTGHNNGPDAVRVVLFRDKESRGATPVAADVLSTGSSECSNEVSAFRNLDNVNRFQILYDKTFILTASVTTTSPAVGPVMKTFRIHKSFPKGLPVTYDDSDTDGTTIRQGDIWLLLLPNSATVADNPNGAFTARVRYTD